MIYFMMAAVFAAIDLLIKHRIEKKRKVGQDTELLKGKLVLHRSHNYGAFLNLGQRKPRVIQAVSLGLSTLLAFILGHEQKSSDSLYKTGLALLLGGALSNTYDRIKRGYVVDYFSFGKRNSRLRKIVLNLGDFGIFLGALLSLKKYF